MVHNHIHAQTNAAEEQPKTKKRARTTTVRYDAEAQVCAPLSCPNGGDRGTKDRGLMTKGLGDVEDAGHIVGAGVVNGNGKW